MVLGCGASVTARARGWSRARTAHVNLATDAGAERAANVAREAERLHQALAHVFFSCAGPDTAIDVVLVASEEYDRISDPTSGGVFREGESGWIAIPDRLILRGTSRGDHVASVFLHELTHRFVATCFPQAPTWLNEGLATTFETLEVGTDSVRIGIPSYQIEPGAGLSLVEIEGVDVQLVDALSVPPPSELVAISADAFYADLNDRSRRASLERSGHYAGAWALVHLLELGGHEALTASFHRYLAGLMEAEQDPDALFTRELAPHGLDALFSEYVAREHYTAYRLPFESPPLAAPEVEPMTESDALRLLAELSYWQGQEALSPIVRAATSLHPEAAWPHLLEASFAETNAERRAAIDAAIARAPNDIEVLCADAYTLMHEREGDQVRLSAVSRALTEESVPTAMGRIALSETLRNLDHPAAALRYATDAVRLDPTSWRAHFQLAITLLDTDRLQAAIRSLRTVLSLTAHRPPEVAAESAALLRDALQRWRATHP